MAGTPDTEAIAAIAAQTAYLPSAAVSTLAGTTFYTKSTVNMTSLPNNTQTGGAFTGASSGVLRLRDIIFQTAAAGNATGPTNVRVTTDNAKGLSGAAAPIFSKAISAFNAIKTVVATVDGTVKELPMVLESGKKLYIHGDDAGGTGGGVADVYCIWERLSDGATIAAANIA